MSRLKKLQSTLSHPILVKKKENLLYLTGRVFGEHEDVYLLVTKNKVIGLNSGLESMDWIKKSDRLKNIGKYISGKKLGLEWGFSYGEGEYIKLKVKSRKLKVAPERSPVDVMRQVKDADELTKVRKSMQIVEKVFEEVKRKLRGVGPRPALTEQALAKFIQDSGLRMGAETVSFPAIVASGANAAVPHHIAGNKKLAKGESIILDFGFKFKGYCSDFTRTVFLGYAPKKLIEAYVQTEKAYNESIAHVAARRGVPSNAGDIYQKSVDVLSEKNLEKYFIHSLGHGTGLEIHELPNLSPKSKDVLTDGMVFSIEPGVYFPKIGGIRIEDLVYLEKGRVKKFIEVPTDLKSNIL